MKTIAATITVPNQIASAIPVLAAALSIFGSGAWRSRIGVELLGTGVEMGALTARSLTRKAQDSRGEIYCFTATWPPD